MCLTDTVIFYLSVLLLNILNKVMQNAGNVILVWKEDNCYFTSMKHFYFHRTYLLQYLTLSSNNSVSLENAENTHTNMSKINTWIMVFIAIPFECPWETSSNCISSMFYFLCSNRTATKIKYKFDILTRMTDVLVTQRTSLYENHMCIYWKCDLFSSKYIFLCA